MEVIKIGGMTRLEWKYYCFGIFRTDNKGWELFGFFPRKRRQYWKAYSWCISWKTSYTCRFKVFDWHWCGTTADPYSHWCVQIGRMWARMPIPRWIGRLLNGLSL